MVLLAAGQSTGKATRNSGLVQTWHLHIEGQVQGVGFRPRAYQLATQHRLNGWVSNTLDGVHIEFNATSEEARQFHQTLMANLPRLAKVTRHQMTAVAPEPYQGFTIRNSSDRGAASLLLSPDFGICEQCRQELFAVGNRREGYPFTTCTDCGPRYSITESLPYDRESTTMQTFSMCRPCREEYDHPTDRRYFSQTNSCPDCAVELAIGAPSNPTLTGISPELIQAVLAAWEDGKIVAIKGIGGYLLTCDAANPDAIQTLRIRKNRPQKPFALMYPSLELLQEQAFLDEKMIEALKSAAAPIVLVEAQRDKAVHLLPDLIAPGLDRMGVMLPYAPLFQLLLHTFRKPIIATSGNISGNPITYRDDLPEQQLFPVADLVLSNNRRIVTPQDDSVIQYSPFHQRKIVLRRSRGYAPTYINPGLDLPADRTVLACGAQLKSTFSFLHCGNTYISQYLGDLDQFDVQRNYQAAVAHFHTLLAAEPQLVLVDQHPEYPSTQYGRQLAQERGIPVKEIQHHLAHFAAVLGENNLVHTREPVLGVIWDGTGLGQDQQIWGGEFFRYAGYAFERCGHLSYFDHILGDKMPREPRLSALSATWQLQGAETLLSPKFTSTEWGLYRKMLGGAHDHMQTSSLGRVFDATASLLGLTDVQTFEGEAAMKLEMLAKIHFQKNGLDAVSSYFENIDFESEIPTKHLMQRIVSAVSMNIDRSVIAARFHISLVDAIRQVAVHQQIQKLAFSGGVFQNGLLVDLLLHRLGTDFDLYFHHQLSPNDENISFGQLICNHITQHKPPISQRKTNHYVLSNSG